MIHDDQREILEAFVKNISTEALCELFDRVVETRKAIEDNANVKLSLARLQVIWKSALPA